MGKRVIPLLLLSCVSVAGCGSDGGNQLSKLPRPVSVLRLVESDPSRIHRVAGTVGSWKNEDLGFEVSGRVRYVIEPETDVEGELVGLFDDESGGQAKRAPITEGQVLATLDDTRYRLAVKSVQAQIETAIQQKKAASIEVTRVIPAQRAAAEADLTFRESEINRNRSLVQSGATSQADFDKMVADRDAAVAALAQIDASKQAKQAEEASLQARIDELRESLAQAERDVADCELRSSFRGQVAQVHVIPGGVVRAGQPVLTVQMMDPIKIDIEVSAATSRRLHYREIVDVIISASDGSASDGGTRAAADTEIRERAFIYTIDPVADPDTRTFTVTLLMRNEKVHSPTPADWEGPVVRARDIWEFNTAPHIKQGALFVEAGSIHDGDDGHYVWKITNWEQVVKKDTAVLAVTKVKVIPGDLRLDWLGLWTFREVQLADGEEFDVEQDFVAGELDSTEPLAGNKILLDRQKWRLRPGDLVGVDLSAGRSPLGFYVPMDIISTSGGQSFVFHVQDGKAQRMQVVVSDGPDTWRRISAVDGPQLSAGAQLIAGGVHYLSDQEPVKVVQEVKVTP